MGKPNPNQLELDKELVLAVLDNACDTPMDFNDVVLAVDAWDKGEDDDCEPEDVSEDRIRAALDTLIHEWRVTEFHGGYTRTTADDLGPEEVEVGGGGLELT
jgi:hypothetical protein